MVKTFKLIQQASCVNPQIPIQLNGLDINLHVYLPRLFGRPSVPDLWGPG